MAEPERPAVEARGWARLPRWQHLILILLCAAGLAAAIANAVVASTSGNRAMHAAFGLVVAVVLYTLVTSFRRRPRERR
jgi:uncharacterized membrane protein YfcA